MGFLRKMFNKSEWDYVANFKDGYALAVRNEHKTVYLIDEHYEVACSGKATVCLFNEESVKKTISNNCKYLAAARNENFYGKVEYYTFLNTQLQEVEGHKYSKILYYVPGKSAIVVEINGDVNLLDGDLKKLETICSFKDVRRHMVVNQEYFYVTDEKTLKLVSIKTKEIKEFEGNHIESIIDGEFYRILQKDGDVYYDKNFNLKKDYERIGKKDKQGRIPIVLKNGEIFIYHCN